MEFDTNALVKRAVNHEFLLKMLSEFTEKVAEQITQIDENCADFDKLSDVAKQRIEERIMKSDLDSEDTPQ